ERRGNETGLNLRKCTATINSTISELPVDSDAENIERSAVGIEGGIGNVLIVTGKPQALRKVYAVKEVVCDFDSGMDKAVPDKAIDAALAQILRMRFRDPAKIDAGTRNIGRPVPRRPLCQESERGRAVRRGVRVNFRFSVGVHGASKDAHIFRD